MDLNGAVGLVTGASSGIGRGTARVLAEAGMKLVLTARREAELNALADEFGRDRALPVAVDLLDEAAPQLLIDAAKRQFGRLDVVFNNAGVMVVGDIDGLDLEAACKMIRVNLESATRLAYVALRHFRQQGSGFLLNVSSTLGRKVRPNVGVYAATKFGIEALTEALRMEVAGSEVQVAALEPGLTETHLQDHFATHPAETLGVSQMVQPEDIGRAVRFMLEQPAHVRIPVLMMQPGEQPM